MNNDSFNFSIIIPHKNIPELLKRCISSIPQRDDIQIIIVDDNSSPDIVDFDHFPGNNRENTTVIFNKEGKYAGHARNIALDYAKGKWILFADADDYYNYCFNETLDEYKDDDSDIIFFKANSVDTEYYTSSNRADDRLNLFIDCFEKDIEKYSNLLKYKCGEPWAKMIKKEIIDQYNIRFEETVIHNDHKFSYILGSHIHRLKVDKRAIYCVTTRKGSVQTNNSDEAKLTRIRVFAEAELFFLQNKLPSYVFWDKHFFQLGSMYYNNKELYLEGVKLLYSLGFNKKNIRFRSYLYSYNSSINCFYKSLLRKLLYRTGIYKYKL